jgi:predicted aldo/keto reductase-like oxidoreductase
MYARSYGQEKVAMTDYSRVPEARNASRCASCPAPCEATCPYEIPIRNRLGQAHRELTLG